MAEITRLFVIQMVPAAVPLYPPARRFPCQAAIDKVDAYAKGELVG